MGLESVPDELFIEIAHRLSIVDILALRRVSKRLCHRTRQRSLWFYFVCRASAQHAVGRFPAQYQHYDEHQLELIACRPLKFQLSLVNSIYTPKEGQHTRVQHAQKKQARAATAQSGGVGANPSSIKGKEREHHKLSSRSDPSRPHHRRRSSSSNNTALTPSRETLVPLREYCLPDDLYTCIHLVRGGRWLLTMSSTGLLRIWDLQPQPPDTSRAQGVSNVDHSQSAASVPWRLCAEETLGVYWRIMEAEVSSDGSVLNIMVNIEVHYEPTARVLTMDLTSMPPVSTTPSPLAELRTSATWKHPAQHFTKSACSFHDHITVFRVTVDTIWVWNWKTGCFGSFQLKGPPNGQIVRVKIISSYLAVIHKVDATKATISLYLLPSLSSPIPPKVDDENGVETLRADPSNLPFAEYLAPLFTSSFRSMHHVQDLRMRPSSSPGRSNSSQDTPRILPFRFCQAIISEPFWLVAPGTERPSVADWDRSERGIFRLGVAIESWSEGSTRTRLQYFLRVDLNAYGPDGGLGTKVAESLEPALTTELPDRVDDPTQLQQPLAENELIPSPQLRGRMSIKTELVYFEDRFIVAAGKKAIMSLWSSNDGVRAHVSLIGKPDKRFEICHCNEVERTKSGSSRPSSGSSRPNSSHIITDSRHQSPPIEEVSEEPPLLGLVAAEGNVSLTPLSTAPLPSQPATPTMPSNTINVQAPPASNQAPHYREKGVTRLIYPYKPSIPSNPYDIPDAKTLAATLPGSGFPPTPLTTSYQIPSPTRSWSTPPNSSFYVNMDFFSGRIVLLQEQHGMSRETFVKVLEYV
ncbi:hypothetical protein FRC03_007964 [Tulasnella sp. 419]|nr:hypothetical protein FRC03_007964 [Tulasnella sp. 419]